MKLTREGGYNGCPILCKWASAKTVWVSSRLNHVLPRGHMCRGCTLVKSGASYSSLNNNMSIESMSAEKNHWGNAGIPLKLIDFPRNLASDYLERLMAGTTLAMSYGLAVPATSPNYADYGADWMLCWTTCTLLG